MTDAPRPVAVACPDKFRGSLTASEAARAMGAGLERAGFEQVRLVPLADGGEGTLDALLAAAGGVRRTAVVTGPLGEPVEAEYGVLRDGTAVVEMARASGLALVAGANRPLDATTAGTGELIAAAVRGGAERLVVGVGGSATTDGGLGALEVLQWSLRGVEVTVACDVTTPFLDAGRVYGRQKGAGPKEVELLSERLERLAAEYAARTGVDVTALAGAGAAGGLAGGLAALGARLEPGFRVVASAAGLDDALDGASLVVTGEGRLDATSFEGKVVGGVVERAARTGVRHVGVIAGSVDESAAACLSSSRLPSDLRVLALVDRACDEDDALSRAGFLVEEASLELGRQVIEPGS